MSFLAASPAGAEMLWTTNEDLPTTFATSNVIGPSAVSTNYSGEAADDFNLVGSIQKVLADGFDCFGDGAVNIDDLVAVILAWGTCGAGECAADLNGDGSVNVDDLVMVLVSWT